MTWSVDPLGTGQGGYRTVETVVGDGCIAGQTTCASTNTDAIAGGLWLGDDPSAASEPLHPPHTLLEFGLGVGSFLDANPSFSTVQVRTSADVASGTTDAGPNDVADFLVST